MAEPVPIRPNLPISISSDATSFCADAIAEFITDDRGEPKAAVLVLFDHDNRPSISFSGATPENLCLVGTWMQHKALGVVQFPDGEDPS